MQDRKPRATAAEVATYCNKNPGELCQIAEMLPHERAEYVYEKLHPQPFDQEEYERAMQAAIESAARTTAVPTDALEELASYLEDIAKALDALPVVALRKQAVDRLFETRSLLQNVRALVDSFTRSPPPSEPAPAYPTPTNSEALRREAHAVNPLLCDASCGYCQGEPPGPRLLGPGEKISRERLTIDFDDSDLSPAGPFEV